MGKYTWLKVLNSPFKLPSLKWYVGKIAVGVPYFYPRKWVKYTHRDRVEAANKALSESGRVKKSFQEWYDSYKNYSKAVPLKIGVSSCGLGWKTKWEETDYRWEWAPILSFVFFKWQIACTVIVDNPDHYWTSWLYYERDTDKSRSKKERLKQCREGFSQIYISHSKEGKKEIDYYELILKKKYLKK